MKVLITIILLIIAWLLFYDYSYMELSSLILGISASISLVVFVAAFEIDSPIKK